MSATSSEILLWIAAIVGIALFLYLLRKFLQGGQYRKDTRIDGKVVIVTGANTGIGKTTAIDMANRGARVYLACRDYKRCEEARKDIIAKTGNVHIYNRTLDLSSLDSVRKFAKKFLEEERRLDILINNAGIMVAPKTLTTDGFESQIGVNHFGHFLLTNLLLDLLKQSAPSRIVVVSSMAYIQGTINKEDLNSEKSYNRFKAYCQSKLANILFTRHLAEKLKGTRVTVNALHPGAVHTELTRHIHPLIMWLAQPFVLFLLKTPVSGAQTQIRLAVDPELDTVTGRYFSDCKEKKLTRTARDDDTAKWLWEKSEELTELTKSLAGKL